jgi:hypothetical protein
MALTLASRLTLNDAINRGHQTYNLVLQNWGNNCQGESGNRAYAIDRPISGCQIAAGSTIGEVIIRYNIGVDGYFKDTTFLGVGEDEYYIRHGRPYHFRTPARITLIATNPSIYYNKYSAWNTAPTVQSSFADELAANVEWLRPTLSMILYLDGEPTPLAEPVKSGFEDQFAYIVERSFNNTTWNLFHFWPIQHLERIRTIVDNESTVDNLEVLFTGIRGVGGSFVTGSGLREYPISSAPQVVAPSSRRSFEMTPHDSTWLGAWVRKQTNAGNSNVYMDVYADAEAV